MTAPRVSRRITRLVHRGGTVEAASRAVPDEVPVAISVNGTSLAVMMASPADLEDFAIGFALAEGVIDAVADIARVAIVPAGAGIDAQLWLHDAGGFFARRRAGLGPVGCGLCGVESIAAALPVLPVVTAPLALSPGLVAAAVAGLVQPLREDAGALHAAGFFRPGSGMVAVREDVGRHSALDKLCGALARAGEDAGTGALILTSRVSVDLVQKAARAGAPVLIAVSTPTALAITAADQAGLTLVARARGESFEVYTHPHRIRTGACADVA